MLTARRATAADATELARLATELAGVVGAWSSRLTAFFHEHVETDRVAAFVIDRPRGGLAACACATITHSIPGPNHAGIYAHIHTVYTAPEYRLRGCARATVQALVDWLTEQGCGLITLNASNDGAHLYSSLGFTANERAMRLIQPIPTANF
ncbi:GNAT family N-acetyltransferase [Kitasatospora aureofaciens]|uniref:GNAT family N-acetyltransferase n=1 Tax=Kitasatospora aureofaciens TaxID=1894 RepID=UPI001C4452BB|nr:GNAT family N-acetyltransferase [Kitasatospora aureofaciens]MBV6700238.1 GNAT family N-acetyltransferase [Kitasatospora aureofaciens]